jgi:co-chaperonin GroES (HSP10)
MTEEQNILTSYIPPVYADIIDTYPFSKTNYLFEPLPWFSKDHFRNINRRHWSLEERKNLVTDTFGQEVCMPTGYNALVVEIADRDETKGGIIINKSWSLSQAFAIGRIIALGESFSDHQKFPFGARATLNDWIIYKKQETTRQTTTGASFLHVSDFAILDVINEEYLDYLIEA